MPRSGARLPFSILAPVIFIFCVVGGFAPTQDMHDVWLILIFGVVGYLMRKLNYAVAPAVLSIVLGPLAERSLRQSLLISHGTPTIFIDRPISLAVLLVALALLLLPVAQVVLRRRRRRQAGA